MKDVTIEENFIKFKNHIGNSLVFSGWHPFAKTGLKNKVIMAWMLPYTVK